MTRPRRIPQPHPAMLALSRKLADTERRLRDLETASQAGFTSVEGRTLDFYDPVTDEKLGSIGLQPDGTFGFERTGGAKPEAPTEPDVQPIPGGAIVAWDGRFEDTQSMLEIDRIAVHMDETPGFTVSRDTEVASLYSHAGGTAVIPIDDGTEWYVKLVAVSKGQAWSDPSTEVHVASIDANIAFFHDTAAITDTGTQTIKLSYEPLPDSEHVYWNGVEQAADIVWTRAERTVTLIDDTALLTAGDVIEVRYAYSPLEADMSSLITASSQGNATRGAARTLPLPAGVAAGQLVVYAIAMPQGRSISNLNGYTSLGTGPTVTHAASSGTYSIRCRVVGWVSDGTNTAPTIGDGTADAVWTCVVFDDRSLGNALSATDSTADATTATTPELAGADLRFWCAVGPYPNLRLTDDGVAVATFNGTDVSILAASNAGNGKVEANADNNNCGWSTVTISLGD